MRGSAQHMPFQVRSHSERLWNQTPRLAAEPAFRARCGDALHHWRKNSLLPLKNSLLWRNSSLFLESEFPVFRTAAAVGDRLPSPSALRRSRGGVTPVPRLYRPREAAPKFVTKAEFCATFVFHQKGANARFALSRRPLARGATAGRKRKREPHLAPRHAASRRLVLRGPFAAPQDDAGGASGSPKYPVSLR